MSRGCLWALGAFPRAEQGLAGMGSSARVLGTSQVRLCVLSLAVVAQGSAVPLGRAPGAGRGCRAPVLSLVAPGLTQVVTGGAAWPVLPRAAGASALCPVHPAALGGAVQGMRGCG